MKNLKRMYINNFQSHKDTKIEFSDTITTFVGPSDSGKTSIFRALELVVKNQPRGTDFITVGQTKTSVGVILEDDTEVVRERTKSVNRYILYNPDGTSVPLEGFGIDVPPDIVEALEYEPVILDTDLDIDLNFSKQLEGPFLLSENNASKAKTIDGLARINVFNIALRNRNRNITTLNLELKDTKRQLVEIEEKLKQYDDLEQLEKTLELLSETLTKLEKLEEVRKTYESLHAHFEQVNQDIKETEILISELKPIYDADKIIQEINFQMQRKQLYSSLFMNYNNILKDMEETEKVLSHKESILQANEAIEKLMQLNEKKKTYNQLNETYLALDKNIQIGEKFIQDISPVLEIDKMLDVLREQQQRKQALMSLSQTLQQTISQVSQQENIINRLKHIREVDSSIAKIEQLMAQREKLVNLGTSLSDTEVRIQKGIDFKEELIEQVEKHKEKYAELLTKFNKCPVCFSELDENHMHEVVHNM